MFRVHFGGKYCREHWNYRIDPKNHASIVDYSLSNAKRFEDITPEREQWLRDDLLMQLKRLTLINRLTGGL